MPKQKINRKGKTSQPSRISRKVQTGHSIARKANKDTRRRMTINEAINNPTPKERASRRTY